jgi:hypothetical protein
MEHLENNITEENDERRAKVKKSYITS